MRYPTRRGRFGRYGGRYIPEVLMPAVEELDEAYRKFRNDREFKRELDYYLREYVGRPTPLTYCANMSAELGFKVYLKREDMASPPPQRRQCLALNVRYTWAQRIWKGRR